MENNENFVGQTENVEQTTEETVVTPELKFTQADMDSAVGKGKARERAKVEKRYEREYGELIDVLRAGTGKESVADITGTFKEFYQKKGIQLKQKPTYSEQDIEVLAKAEADEIIRSGYEEVVEEVERLANKGAENMTAREKAVFTVLAKHRQNAERVQELSRIGVSEDVYNSQEYKDFASQFNPNIPVEKVYDLYRKTQPQKEHRTMGSMKNNPANDTGVKDFYTREEALRFTKADFDKNPELFKAVEQSSYKW